MRTAHKVAAALLASFALPASAAVPCSGLVAGIAIEPDGAVWAAYGHGMHRLCMLNGNHSVNLGTEWKTLTPATCQALYSSFLTAKSSGREVRGTYERSDCAIGNWVDPNPYPRLWEFPQ